LTIWRNFLWQLPIGRSLSPPSKATNFSRDLSPHNAGSVNILSKSLMKLLILFFWMHFRWLQTRTSQIFYHFFCGKSKIKFETKMKTKTEMSLQESCLFIFEHLSSDWFCIAKYAHAKLTSLISGVWLAVKMSAYCRRTNRIKISNLARPKAENVNKTLTKITTLK